MTADPLVTASGWMVGAAGVLYTVGPVVVAVAFVATAFVAFAVGRFCERVRDAGRR